MTQVDDTVKQLLNKITQQVAVLAHQVTILAHQVDMLQIHNSISLINISLFNSSTKVSSLTNSSSSKTVPINISPIPTNDSETISQPPNSDSPILPALKLLSDRPIAALDDSRHREKKSEDKDFIQLSCFFQPDDSMIGNDTFESTILIYDIDSGSTRNYLHPRTTILLDWKTDRSATFSIVMRSRKSSYANKLYEAMLRTYEHELFASMLERNGKIFFEKVVFIFDPGSDTFDVRGVFQICAKYDDACDNVVVECHYKKMILRTKCFREYAIAWSIMISGITNHGSQLRNIENFTITVGDRDLIQDGSVTLDFGRHYGLVGRNGTGRTSFLRHMAMHAIDGITRNFQIFQSDRQSLFVVAVDDGEHLYSSGTCRGINVRIQGHKSSINFHLLDIAGVDAILGIQWLEKLEPITTDHQKLIMSFWINGQVVQLKGLQNKLGPAEISVYQLKRELAKVLGEKDCKVGATNMEGRKACLAMTNQPNFEISGISYSGSLSADQVIIPVSSLPISTKSISQQFVGDYEADKNCLQSYKSDNNRLHVHPMFSHSNATSHKWVFGAIAELLYNAIDEGKNGATSIYLDKFTYPRDGNPALLIRDDGGGMDPESLRQCMSFSFSNKDCILIRHYGNDFMTGTMRMCVNVIVFSHYFKSSTLIVLPSYTFLRQMQDHDIVVSMFDYKFVKETGHLGSLYQHGQKEFLANLSTLLTWSPFSSEEKLLHNFDDIGNHGTNVIIFNLWYNGEGNLEINFDSDPGDIIIIGVHKQTQSDMSRFQNKRHISRQLWYSLRVYSSMGMVAEQYYLTIELNYVECKIKMGKSKVLIFDPGGIFDAKQHSRSLTLRTRSFSKRMVMIRLHTPETCHVHLQSLEGSLKSLPGS